MSVCVLHYEIQVRFYLLKQSVSLNESVDSVTSLNNIKLCAFNLLCKIFRTAIISLNIN